MSQSLLYYPSINIEDGEWLRSAAFYWDEVCSIVPYAEFDDFSPEIQYMHERGQYRAIFPQDMLNSPYSEEFMQTIERRMKPKVSQGSFSHDYYDRQAIHIRRDKTYNPSLYTLVHYKKFPNELVERLIEIGNISTDEEGWIEMDSKLANIYMKTLAEFVALYDNRDMVISSDRISNINEIYPFAGNNPRSRVLSITLQQCLPVPSMEVPFEDLLDFKRHRRDDLYELKRKIRKLELEIAQCESQFEVKSILAAFREEWQYELGKAEKMFRGDRIAFGLTGLLTFVANVSGAAGLTQWMESSRRLPFAASTIGIGVGSIGLIGVNLQHRNYKKKIREDQLEKGFAYIIGAKHNNLLRNIELM